MSIVPDADARPLGRMQKLAAKSMIHSWTTVPHVTHHDWAHVDAIEALRADAKAKNVAPVSALALYVKAVAATLQRHAKFNALYDPGEAVLWQRHHCHIGIAIAIPDGLVVAVVRDCETKSPVDITAEIAAFAAKARTSGLSYAEMADGGFTISSLGATGGDGFTPIVNAPQVAILGIGRMQDRPVRIDDDGLGWRRMIPLSLSYDHRVIGGAEAAEFLTSLKDALAAPVA